MTNSRAPRILKVAKENATIVTGVLTISGGFSRINITGEGSTNDTLDTINGGKDGQIIILSSTSASQDITFTENGNMGLVGTTFVTVNSTDYIMLVFIVSTWYELSRSSNNT